MASRVSELAREESERVEAEAAEAAAAEGATPEGDETPPGIDPATGEILTDPAPEPEPPAMTEAQLEERMKAWDRERDRHMRELNKRDPNRYGASEPCPLCDGHGLYLPLLPEPDKTARREYIATVLGGEEPPELDIAADKVECPSCHGWGRTLTGSKVPGQDALPCAGCNGMGWTAQLHTPTPIAPPQYQPVPNLVAPPPPNGVGPLDSWQRPVGHPHYGIPPSEVGT